jgi:hypothetical protein
MAAARGARRRGVRVEKCILGGWKQKEDGRKGKDDCGYFGEVC